MLQKCQEYQVNNDYNKCTGWCVPAVLFLILSIVSTIAALLSKPRNNNINTIEYKFTVFVIHILFIVVWTSLLYWLCSKCQYGYAWLIFFIPIIIGLVFMFLILDISDKILSYTKDNNNIDKFVSKIKNKFVS